MKYRPLHHKLARTVSGSALLLALLCAGMLFTLEFKRASLKTDILLNQLLDTMEKTAAVAAYANNRAIGDDVLRGLLRNDIVYEARLSNDRGLDLRQVRAANTGPIPAATFRDLQAPFGAGDPVGRLSVAPDHRFIFQEAMHGALLAALDSSLLIGLTTLLILRLVRSRLSQPLAEVSNVLHAIKAGERERLPTLAYHQDDELGQLVTDINGLLATLEEKFVAERRLREAIQAVEQRLRDIFQNTSAGIFVLDEGGHLLAANPTLGRVLGLPGLEDLSPENWDFPSLAFAEPDQFHTLIHQAGVENRVVAQDIKLRHQDGAASWVHCLLSRHIDREGDVRFEGVVYDITERRTQEMRVRHEADHDPLTGLLRRHAAERELLKLLAAPPWEEATLLMLDLDNFKAINDTLGHDAGDAVLIEAARRLRTGVRSQDVVARLGGDEFLIALADSPPPQRVAAIAQHLVAAILEPIALADGTAARVGVSIGGAGRQANLQDWLKAADMAMYEVKRRGKNGYGLTRHDGGIEVEILTPPQERKL